MAAWSNLLAVASRRTILTNPTALKGISQNVTRCMSDARMMPITASRWQWHKTKDFLHLYFMVGLIPVVIIVVCSNLFVGPATLQPIPEGYDPKHWEYCRHPITRFMARYLIQSPQQRYEKILHILGRDSRIANYRRLVHEVEDQIMMYGDQQGLSNPRFFGGKFYFLRGSIIDKEKVR